MPLTLDTPLAALPLLLLDLETTGLELGAGDRVAEVALLRERGGVEEGRLDTLVNPGRPLDPGAAAVNGLRDAELALAPSFAALTPTIEALAAGAVLVGHNIGFDLAFLNAELHAAGRPRLAGPSLDTLVLAKRLLRQRSYSLAALAEQFGLPRPTHRAMADVLATRGLFHALAGMLAPLGVHTLGDALRFERGLPPGMAEPEAPPLIAQAMAEQRALLIVYRSRSTPEPTARTVRPMYLTVETSGLFLKAYCELRQNVRSFAIAKIEMMTLV